MFGKKVIGKEKTAFFSKNHIYKVKAKNYCLFVGSKVVARQNIENEKNIIPGEKGIIYRFGIFRSNSDKSEYVKAYVYFFEKDIYCPINIDQLESNRDSSSAQLLVKRKPERES